SRDHLHIKGAEVPFEDEKFSYAVLSRSKPQSIGGRVLAQPKITKSATTTKLCTGEGIVTDIAPRRDPDAYRRRKSWRRGAGGVRKINGDFYKTWREKFWGVIFERCAGMIRSASLGDEPSCEFRSNGITCRAAKVRSRAPCPPILGVWWARFALPTP